MRLLSSPPLPAIAVAVLCCHLCLLSLPSSSAQSIPSGIPTLTISDSINFTLPPPLTAEQTYAAIQSLSFHNSTRANTVRSHLPRFYGPDFTLTDSQQLEQWAKGSILYIVPGCVMAAVTAAVWLAVACWQCCCRQKWASEGAQVSRGSGAPALVVLCLLLSSALVIVALVYNSSVSAGLTSSSAEPSILTSNSSISFLPQDNTVGVTTAVSAILSDIDVFFTAFPLLLLNLINQVNILVPQVQLTVANASNVLIAFQRLETQMLDTLDTVSSARVGNYSCASVSSCAVLLQPLLSLSEQLENITVPVIQIVQSDIATINADLVSAQLSIDSALTSAVLELGQVEQQTTSYSSDATVVVDDVNKYDRYRFVLTIVFLLLPAVCLLLVVLPGLCLHSSFLFKLNMHLLFLSSVILWLLFAAHLAITSATSDSCIYADQAELTLPQLVNDATVSSVLQACLLNTSLVTAVNISEPLSFAFSIAIPNITDVEQIFDVQQLQNFSTSVSSLSVDVFGYNSTLQTAVRQDALTELNQLTAPDVFTLSNVSACVPSKYGQAAQEVAAAQAVILESLAVQQTLSQLLTGVQANITSAVAQSNAIINQANALFTGFLTNASIILPVVNAGQQVIDSAYCGSLGQGYGDAKVSLCSQVQLGVGMIALACFVIALLLIPAIYCSWLHARAEEADKGEEAGEEGAGEPSMPSYATVSSPSSTPPTGAALAFEVPPLPPRPSPRPSLPARPQASTSQLYPALQPYPPPHLPHYAPSSYGATS